MDTSTEIIPGKGAYEADCYQRLSAKNVSGAVELSRSVMYLIGVKICGQHDEVTEVAK